MSKVLEVFGCSRLLITVKTCHYQAILDNVHTYSEKYPCTSAEPIVHIRSILELSFDSRLGEFDVVLGPWLFRAPASQQLSTVPFAVM